MSAEVRSTMLLLVATLFQGARSSCPSTTTPGPCDCIATPPGCDSGPYYASCGNIGYAPEHEFDISGNTWTGLGVHEPYTDNYVYTGPFDTRRFSGQWIKHEAKGYLVR